ncbi:CapA family protein [Candidatus Nephthysia bennettiae]|uniref:CapA family protein n=1 Tax=Candidatus Nephthysia bennettiae TaxID=3127016 RepID=A0A934KEX2_9BACT|nr:CapA family protein [Candidatus Dormibacteraeota bacterium]
MEELETSSRDLLLLAVGDVHMDREDPESALALASSVLSAADVLFGNCEGVYTDGSVRAPSAGIPVVSGLRNAQGLAVASFDVMNCANNHIVDGGHEGLADTLAALRRLGIQPVGAGASLDEARQPAVIERNGTQVGFIAFGSDFPPGYEARQRVPGLNPMRIHTHYCKGDGETLLPGGPPRIVTSPYGEDLQVLADSISAIREVCDVVVCSFHWGEGLQPVVLMDYERDVARRAIDFGADVVLCHHHHTMRGVDFYRGSPIFHGICHFVPDYPNIEEAVPPEMMKAIAEGYGDFAIQVHDDYPLLPMHPDARMAMIAACRISDGEVEQVGVIPCCINANGQPHPVELDGADGRRWLDYFERTSWAEGFDTGVTPAEDRVHDAPLLILRPGQGSRDKCQSGAF